jgi:hypothetical protein
VTTFDIRNVRKAPMRKLMIDMRVVSHACGLAGRPAVLRPRMTVLPAELSGCLRSSGTTCYTPVCMPMNMPQFLKLAASTMPVTRQQANSGRSP